MVQRKEVFQILSRILEVSETRTGTQCKLRMVMSGWFIFLPLFFSGYNKDWKQHISYSSVIAQAGRTLYVYTQCTQSVHSVQTRGVRVSGTPWRHEGGPAPKEWPASLLASPFYALQLSDWFSLMQNRACTHHQLEKGMQAVTLLRLISEEGCFGGVFSCQKVSLPPSAFSLSACLPAVVFLVATFWSQHLGVLFSQTTHHQYLQPLSKYHDKRQSFYCLAAGRDAGGHVGNKARQQIKCQSGWHSSRWQLFGYIFFIIYLSSSAFQNGPETAANLMVHLLYSLA